MPERDLARCAHVFALLEAFGLRVELEHQQRVWDRGATCPERSERPWVTDEDPRIMMDTMRMASLDMWALFNYTLEDPRDDASLMKAFIEQKAEVLHKQ